MGNTDGSESRERSDATTDDTVTLDLRADVLPPRKVFWDPVHGQISLHPVSVAVIDTPEFQRLRYIRQLGHVAYLYPGASNSRFEHSLGTAHLARLLGSHLRDCQPELKLSDKELLCLELAGLCHDLGHGPFSHFWEHFYRRGARDRGLKPRWTHEAMSCKILAHLIAVNGLDRTFSAWEAKWPGQGLTADDVKFVQGLILGDTSGIEPSRWFLFQVVNNRDSGLDVDKWDYYLRDCHAVGLACGFQFQRLVGSARVVEHEGFTRIAFRDKELNNVYEMFRMRSTLHNNVYHHQMISIFEAMICDALQLADEKVASANGGGRLRLWWTTHEAGQPDASPQQVEAFVALTDAWVELSVRRADAKHQPEVLRAQQLWRALETRSRRPCPLYRFLGSVPKSDDGGVGSSEETLREAIMAALPEDVKPKAEDLVVDLVNIHWGCGKDDPVKKVLFYRKAEPDRALHAEQLRVQSSVLPSRFLDARWNVLLRAPGKPGLDEHVGLCLKALQPQE
uniref:Sam/hd domain protein n=1 Tax=Rhipicephalus zambeziensis TaxID=60191 RepID=A0A224YNL5_9ACAR